MVASDKAHMVSVDKSEGDHAVAYNGEEGHEHVVDNVDVVLLLLTDVNPPDEEEHPRETKDGD